MQMFDRLKDNSWTEINADKSFNDLHDELLHCCNNAIDNIANEKLDVLWWKSSCIRVWNATVCIWFQY